MSDKPRGPLSRSQRWLALATGVACTGLAVLGGLGSFDAVKAVAAQHGFAHPERVPLEVDVGVLALFFGDLLLEWQGMPFAPLRWVAHALVGATIWFNVAAAKGDPLGMAMHAVAPLLVVIWVEGVRHAIRTSARMAKRRRHIESAQLARWLLAPLSTAKLWRRQQLWNVSSYTDALELERRRLLAIAAMRDQHGWRWRQKASRAERLTLRFGLEPPSPSGVGRFAEEPGPTPRPTIVGRPRRASRGGQRGARTEQARIFIAELRATGRPRPADLHIRLHRDFGLERTQARRFAERHWPVTEGAA